MKPEKKINVAGTLQKMQQGQRVVFPLAECAESTLRIAVSRARKRMGCEFSIVRDYPNLIVTRG